MKNFPLEVHVAKIETWTITEKSTEVIASSSSTINHDSLLVWCTNFNFSIGF